MWLRNLLFLGLVGGGVFTLGVNLMPPRRPRPVTSYDAGAYRTPEFRAAVDRFAASLRGQSDEQSTRLAPPSSDLLVTASPALVPMGTVPSLKEVCKSESMTPGGSPPWWLDHVMPDQRFADNFAERF